MFLSASKRCLRCCSQLSRSASTNAYSAVTHPDNPPTAQVAETLTRHAKSTLNTYARPPIMFTKGKGCKLWDTKGKEYLDLSGGIAVNALGHADEGVASVLAEQSLKLSHLSNLFHNEHAGELAVAITEATLRHGGLGFAPDSKHASDASTGLKVFFTNSGTESNEGALKFIRKYAKTHFPNPTPDKVHPKHEIVCFTNAFHGRSMGALSCTMQAKYQDPFRPLIPGIVEAQIDDLASIERVITEKTCGVIIEPIQGEGGITEASVDFLRALRAKCDEVGALLIYDEIQCGLGRTGSLWAHSVLPIDCHPDIVTMAKPLANGFPVGAILMTDKVADVIKIGDHGTTFGGSPLATAVAGHVFKRITEPSFLQQVNSKGALLSKRLRDLAESYPTLVSSPPRGRGLIQGLPLANAELPGKVAAMCRERGVLVLTCGKNTLRFVPSLTITTEEIEKGCDVVSSVLDLVK